jgi:hypothetical protein
MARAQHIVVVSAMIVSLGAAAVRAQSAAATSDKADALSEAARKGDTATVKKLLDEGVDVNTKFRYGATALSYACDRGHVDVVKLLLERGADPNVKDTFYKATPLTWAVSPATGRTPQHPEVVRLLLQHGAQDKENALMAAVSEPDAATTKVILDTGGLPAGALSDALEAATRTKQPEIVALLEQAGAKPRVEVKLDAAQLGRYVGSYRDSGDAAQVSLVVTTADGRLIATFGGRRLTLIARDQSTFGVAEQPGATVTFRLDQDKATGIVLSAMGTSFSFTRTEDK